MDFITTDHRYAIALAAENLGQFTTDLRRLYLLLGVIVDRLEGPAACPEGSKRCEGNLLMQCDQGGAWAVYTDCSPRLCVEDACVTPDGDEEAEQDDGQTEVVTGGSDDGCATGGGSVLLLAVALLCLSRASRRRRGASPNGPDCRHPAT